jgi:hypothetical protein
MCSKKSQNINFVVSGYAKALLDYPNGYAIISKKTLTAKRKGGENIALLND